ncbi:FKBP-type peptidyl-prolyl cis-trans isomerase [Pricia sp. S334]|uniref:Peptidyl-prolyl cis-trans isomerase n=1 Tax=Pricia mediterranea TaxID=3076079 RepID=A0ABU3L9N9_9FLAO|nr:FKBP-type peptidyl-prolyl cis-trans isomerase [Pricia sp. S334]MDT7829914.1 FKBP-type peptidyl-prolyl cis-trans isomerase [Pricia sp. S334]
MSRVAALFAVGLLVISCNNDDEGAPPPVPPRPLAEVAAEDEAKIQEYLNTHYYNYEDFENPTEDFDYRVVVKKIPEGDTLLKPLSMQTASKTVHLSSSDLNLEGDEQNIEHKMYFLKAREGVGESPTEVDSVFLRYEGSRLDGTVFDSNIGNPSWLDLQGTLSQGNSGTIQGFKRGLPQFKSGGDIIVNDDGTFEVKGFGSGLLIFPSALGYYNSPNVGASYSPLVFNIQLLVSNTADHDRDGTPTKDEVEIDEEGNVTLTDTNNDGIPDYLDPDTK